MTEAMHVAKPRVHQVWGLNVLMGIAMVGVCLAVVLPGDGALADPGLPWWLLAAFIAVAERWPVHLEFRRSAHSFSMTDIPLVLGLVFATPAQMLLGVLAGTAIAMGLRRMPSIKLTFNLVQFVLCAGLAIGILRLVAGDADPGFGPLTWLGVVLGLQLSSVVGMALVCTAILLSDGGIARAQVAQMFTVDSVVTLTNTSLALLLSILVIEQPEAVPIIAIPVAVVYASYRSFAAERERREKLQFLYETNRTFLSAPEVTEAIGGLLEHAMEAFRAERAEVVLFSMEEGIPPVRVAVRGDGAPHVLEAVLEPGVADLLGLVEDQGRPAALEAPFTPGVRSYLERRGIKTGVAALLRGEERAVGVLVLANRSGIDQRFSPDDVTLVETLAANASAALQYDRLEQAVRELRLLQDRLHHQAFHDGLTGLANRALFHQDVGAALRRPGDREVSVVFFDLDDFKAVNDTFGHALGDELLAATADRLRTCVTDDDDVTVARLGGDEFAVLLTAEEDVERHAAALAGRILDAFKQPVQAAGHPFTLSLSFGISTSRHSGASAPDLLRDADVAMYEAKAAGKGRWSVFDPAMRDSMVERHGLRAELERAIEEEQLVVQFQPIVDLRSGQAAAVEALVRWDHPVRGRIPPAHFVPLAEESGLVIPLGRFVLREACRHAAHWQTAGVDGAPLGVHVNLSARELEDPGIVASVAAALELGGIEPQQLVLELTETLLVEDAERGARTLTGLRELGVRLALDDFGTGFSSLSYLRSLPLDQLKIAREFVDGLGRQDQDQDHNFVRLILELAQGIGLEVVAEGVETAEQLKELKALGCDYAQGFYLARPADAGAALSELAGRGT